MTPRSKARLFHDLGQLIHSGMAFPKAVEKLRAISPGSAARVLRGLSAAVMGGSSVAEAFTSQQPQLGALETGIFIASDRAGRLDQGLAHAAEYYEAIAAAQGQLWSKMAYPLFILHFSALSTAVVQGFRGDGFDVALRSFIMMCAGIWATIFAVRFLYRLLLSTASRSGALDRALCLLPPFGKLRRSFALSRFCAAYNLQIEAGVNAYASLETAGRASSSATITAACTRALDDLRAGEKVGEALAKSRAFPEPILRGFLVGEESGRLDQELRRLADEYRATALRRLDAIIEWIPRLIYIGILIYVGWQIVRFYQGYLDQVKELGL